MNIPVERAATRTEGKKILAAIACVEAIVVS
jgi:hypothetical protein